jgi:serine/threonine-protein kinase
MRDLATGERLDRYEITDLLSRGGMGCVFKATDLVSGETVVLKVPHEHLESDIVFYERFKREEEIGRRLDHPGIVKFLSQSEQSRMYLAMEYVPGGSLRALMSSARPLPVERALAIAQQLCAALAYLHDQGVVHRDVKPENVLLVPPDGSVKLLDFGIAFLESARRLTWAGLSGILGTPDYMAPEQVQGRRGDARTDVYAVGTILYEMLTGHLPYEAPDAVALLHAKTHRDPTPAGQHVPGIEPGLAALLARALARDRNDRYATAREMLEDLQDPSRAARRPVLARQRRTFSWPWPRHRQVLLTSMLIGALAAGVASLSRLATDRHVRASPNGAIGP